MKPTLKYYIRYVFTSMICLIMVHGGIFSIMPCCYAENLAAGYDVEKPKLLAQLGHTGFVSAVAFSPDGTLVLTGASDHNLMLWNASTGNELRVFKGHTDAITTVTFSPDGRFALSAGYDKTLRLWDIQHETEIRTFSGHSTVITSVVFSPDGKHALSGSSIDMKLWDVASGKLLRSFGGDRSEWGKFMKKEVSPGPESWVHAVTFAGNGKYLVCGSDDGLIKFIDKDSGIEVMVLEGNNSSVNVLSKSNDENIIFSGSDDGTIKAWDVNTGKILKEFTGKWGAVRSLSVSRDTSLVFFSGSDGIIHVFDFLSGQEIRSWESGLKSELGPSLSSLPKLLALSVSPDNKSILSISYSQRSASIWDVSTGRILLTLQGYGQHISKVEQSTDNAFLLVASSDSLNYWELATGMITHFYDAKKHSNAQLEESWSFSKDGRYGLFGSRSGMTKLQNFSIDKEILTSNGHPSWVSLVTFSKDNKYALSGSSASFLEIIDLSKKNVTQIQMGRTGFGKGVGSVVFSPDGKDVFFGGDDGQIQQWNLSKKEKIKTWGGGGYSVHSMFESLDITRDGKFLLSGSNDNTVKLWDVSKDIEIKTLVGHSEPVSSVSFSNDGKLALSGSHDRNVKLWDTNTGKELITLIGHSDYVKSVAFLGDERFAISSASDAVMLWDISTGKWLAKLFSFKDGTWVVINPQGQFDTNNLDGIQGLHWIMPDEPLRALPLEIFMKDYYEPRLLPRILNAEKLKPIRALNELNRVLPTVLVHSIEREGDGDAVTVKIFVAKNARVFEQRGKKISVNTGVHDIKLFRDGQLVAFQDGEASLDKTNGETLVTFKGIRLPRRDGVNETEFSTYAFNDDGVKSLTSRRKIPIPSDLKPQKGKAYLLTIGVSNYQNSALNLKFAANDAVLIRNALASNLAKGENYSDIISIHLTDNNATKPILKGVFDLLSGKQVVPEIISQIPNSKRIGRATPEDLLIISFAGHGYVDDNGVFYAFTHDTGEGSMRTITSDLLGRVVSSDELSRWLRDVDAGDMAMIIDACHSAASVDAVGFKPGPMGSRGLGQLAYDKGMRILAASQADNVALESEKLQHGLLSYALVHDGIEAFQADFKPANKKTIYLGEWLAYGVERVPELYKEINDDKLNDFGIGEASRGLVIHVVDHNKSLTTKTNPYQTPALFDYVKRKKDVPVTKKTSLFDFLK